VHHLVGTKRLLTVSFPDGGRQVRRTKLDPNCDKPTNSSCHLCTPPVENLIDEREVIESFFDHPSGRGG